ncbi:branched-chain amino acid ABC transporter permease [Oceanobacillus salinisoli]|uniref:branched-chain amino acid ABC transporter permease n=1 Tax=Oceanobacillus salinisoli TaxID=2678611 RepID=UPI001E47AD01|nr:branched-chain amino acid ABC transporter permease [Oceanobacillus salinisoli]
MKGILTNRRNLFIIAAILFIIAPVFIQSNYYFHILVFLFLNTILAVSWNLIFQTGQVSLAHVAFMAIGAYTSTLLVLNLNLPFLLSFILAGILSSIVAVVIGMIVLRLKGIYFVMITFILTEIVRLTITNSTEALGGASGISGIPYPNIFGYVIESRVEFYYLFLAILMITIYVIYRLLHSRVGNVLKSISNNDTLSQAVGVNISYYKIFAFAAGAFFAGLAGALYAHYNTHISPHSFTFLRSFDIIIFNIVGGTANLLGPILGSSVFTILPEFFRSLADYQVLVYSLALIASIYFLKDGLLSIVQFFTNKLKKHDTKEEVKNL